MGASDRLVDHHPEGIRVGLFGKQGTLREWLGGHVTKGTANTSSGRGRVEGNAGCDSAEPKI